MNIVEENKNITKTNKKKIGLSQLLSRGSDFTVVTYSLSTIELLSLKKFLVIQDI